MTPKELLKIESAFWANLAIASIKDPGSPMAGPYAKEAARYGALALNYSKTDPLFKRLAPNKKSK